MNLPWSRLEGPARLLVTCIAILLVAAGLCGLQLVILNVGTSAINNGLASLFFVTGIIELAAMAISALLAFGAFLVWIWRRIAGE